MFKELNKQLWKTPHWTNPSPQESQRCFLEDRQHRHVAGAAGTSFLLALPSRGGFTRDACHTTLDINKPAPTSRAGTAPAPTLQEGSAPAEPQHLRQPPQCHTTLDINKPAPTPTPSVGCRSGAQQSKEKPLLQASPCNLAYATHTSGSTGHAQRRANPPQGCGELPALDERSTRFNPTRHPAVCHYPIL